MMLRRVLLALLLLMSGACRSAPSEPTPEGLVRYLDALAEGDLEAAYRLTQLDDLAASFGSGAAIDEKHFAASWERHPLTGSDVTEVIPLRKRDINDFGAGDPFYETVVRFETETSSWQEEIAVEGDLSPTVVVGVYPIEVTGVPRRASVSVNDIPLDARIGRDGTLQLILLGGRHEVTIDDRTLELDTAPLAVTSGAATIPDEGAARIELTD